MNINIGTIAIYVEDQEASQKFWVEKVGFKTIKEDQLSPHQFWIEVAPNQKCQSRLIIYSKEMVFELEPDSICHPTIVFECDDIEAVYKDFIDKKIVVGEIQVLFSGKFFEFKDNEKNSYIMREFER